LKIAFDEHVAPKLAEAIKALSGEGGMLRAEIVPARKYLMDPLKKQESDVPWLEAFANDGGKVVVSGDARMRAKPHEQAALRECGFVTIFFARAWNNLNGFNKAAMLIRWWPYILSVIESAKPGQMFEIPCTWHGTTLKEVTPKRRAKPGAKPKEATPTQGVAVEAKA
jgi:PIN like domain